MTSSDPRPPEPLDLEEIYDDATLSLIEAQEERGAPRGPVGTTGAAGRGAARTASSGGARLGGIRGAVLAGAMLGVAEALDPEPEKQAVIEFAPERADHHDDPVEFVFVYGAPSRSRIIFRPWLCARPNG